MHTDALASGNHPKNHPREGGLFNVSAFFLVEASRAIKIGEDSLTSVQDNRDFKLASISESCPVV